MIVITGALGFIGSSLVTLLNEKGHTFDILVVDDFYKDHKEINLKNKFIREWIHRDIFLDTFEKIGSLRFRGDFTGPGTMWTFSL